MSNFMDENLAFRKAKRDPKTNKMRITANVDNKVDFVGAGRNKITAKLAAAKKALRYLKRMN